MQAESLILGDVEILSILDIDALMPIRSMFGEGEPPPGGVETLATRLPLEFTPEAWRFRDHCFVIRSPRGVVLIDTGVGPTDSTFGRFLSVGGSLPDRLDAIGVAPADVDHVILTHIHADHTGWNTVREEGRCVPRFPNARYHLHEVDVELGRSRDDPDDLREFDEVIEPLIASGQLDTEPEDHDVMPGLGLRHSPGHTPGHRCVLLELGDERVLFAGDLLHFSFQFDHTTYLSPADEDPAEAARSRTAWLERAEAAEMTLATAHLLPPIGRMARANGSVRLLPR